MNAATFPTYDTVDLFAGPGGWSVAAQRLGLREIGLEFDKAAHLTRRAAGFHTIRDDVRNWGPANFPNARGLIASPPCQTFSAAGKGAGRRALDVVLGAVAHMHAVHLNQSTYVQPTWEDERTGLVLEPLRWALEAARLGRPYEWLAFEQVPTVLPVWQAMADVLRAEGYSVAVGNLQAEQYGVPQTRKRAVLIARAPRVTPLPVELPTPTHSRYHTHDKARLDPGVLPWVSMAQALGWGADERPGMTVTGGGTSAGGAEPFGNAARQGLKREQDAGRWVVRTSMGTPKVDGRNGTHELDPHGRPAHTVTTKTGEWSVEQRSRLFAGAGRTAQNTAGQIPRAEVEPAHTVTGKGTAAWIQRERSGDRAAEGFPTDQPAQTLTSKARSWTVHPAPREGYAPAGSVRVSVEEAACLQSFPAGFPWQGSRTKQYQQIGNAIPPLLAEAVLASALGRTLPEMTP